MTLSEQAVVHMTLSEQVVVHMTLSEQAVVTDFIYKREERL